MLKLTCPYCQSELAIMEDLRGNTVQCPNCNKNLIISSSTEKSSAAECAQKKRSSKIKLFLFITAIVILGVIVSAFVVYAKKSERQRMQSSRNFQKLLMQHPRGTYTLSNVIYLLNQCNLNTSVAEFPEAIELVQIQVDALLDQNMRDEQFLENLKKEIETNPSWKLINFTELLKKIEQLKQQRLQLLAEEEEARRQQIIAQVKAEYKQVLEGLNFSLKMMSINFRQEDLLEMYNHLQKLEPSQLRQTGCELLYLCAYSRNEESITTSIVELGGQDMQDYLNTVFRKCRHCTDGLQKCISCQGSGVCFKCQGRGNYKGTVITDGHFVEKIYYCTSKCEDCPTVICDKCKGSGRITQTTESENGSSSRSYTCGECNGRGKLTRSIYKCTKCQGTGRRKLGMQQLNHYKKQKLEEFARILKNESERVK